MMEAIERRQFMAHANSILEAETSAKDSSSVKVRFFSCQFLRDNRMPESKFYRFAAQAREMNHGYGFCLTTQTRDAMESFCLILREPLKYLPWLYQIVTINLSTC